MQTESGDAEDVKPRMYLYAGVTMIVAALLGLQVMIGPVEAETQLQQGYATAQMDASIR